MEEKQARNFVTSNMVPVTALNYGSRCIDDRKLVAGQPLVEERIPVVSKPGGDMGDLLLTLGVSNELKLGLSSYEAYGVLIEAVGGVDKIKWHTDTTAEQKQAGVGMGCGHIKTATDNPHSYGLTQQQIQDVRFIMADALNNGAKQTVIDGNHAAKAVIVVDSPDYGVIPGDGEQAFIYHKALHRKQLDRLAEVLVDYLHAKDQKADYSIVRRAFDKVLQRQLAATVEALAKDLPQHVVGSNGLPLSATV